jgi:hypothetical protein
MIATNQAALMTSFAALEVVDERPDGWIKAVRNPCRNWSGRWI